MVNKACCVLAAALFGGFAMTSLYSTKPSHQLEQTLDTQQQVKYQEIADYRRRLATQGMVLGALLCVVYVLYARSRGEPVPSFLELACSSVAILLATTYLYYMITPKKEYLAPYLRSDQMNAYMETMYTYNLRFNVGLLLGAAGAYFLGQGMSK